jgi:hypothetical protein
MTAARLSVFSTCLLLSACAEEEIPGYRSLAEAENLGVSLRLSAVSDTDEMDLWLMISGRQPIALGSDFGLRVNDYPAESGRDSVIAGRLIPVDLPTFPSVSMKIPAAQRVAPAEVVVTDGLDEIVFDLGDALLPRSATWLQPADGVLHGGDDVALQWSPATDSLGSDLLASVYPQEQYVRELELTADAAGVLTGTTRALVPADDAGVGISWRPPGRSAPCFQGTCTWSVDHIVRVPATIVDAP